MAAICWWKRKPTTVCVTTSPPAISTRANRWSQFRPTALVGIYQWPRPQGDITYLRFAFSGEVGEFAADRQLDDGILRAVWLTPAEIEACRERHRSPLILHCLRDHIDGRRFPLDLIRHYSK